MGLSYIHFCSLDVLQTEKEKNNHQNYTRHRICFRLKLLLVFYYYYYFVLLPIQVCSTCQRPITADAPGVTHNSLHWHACPHCFSCHSCARALLNQPFILKDGRLYCSSDCHYRLNGCSHTASIARQYATWPLQQTNAPIGQFIYWRTSGVRVPSILFIVFFSFLSLSDVPIIVFFCVIWMVWGRARRLDVQICGLLEWRDNDLHLSLCHIAVSPFMTLRFF